MFNLRAFIASLLLLICITGSRAAEPITLEEFFRLPEVASPELSHNGRYFAYTAPYNGKRNLTVLDLETNKATLLTNFKDFDVMDVEWVGNDRLLFSLGNVNGPSGPEHFEGGGLFMVSRDGKETRQLSETVKQTRDNGRMIYRQLAVHRTLPDSDVEVIAEGNLRSAESQDLYRLNIRTGKLTLLTFDRPDRTWKWVLDSKMVPRVVVSGVKDELTRVVWYRKDAKSPWVELLRYDMTKGPTFVPLAFEDDDQTLQVASNEGRDTMAIYRYDPEKRQRGELIAAHPRFDIGADAASDSEIPGVLTDWKTGKIVGYRVDADKPETVWIDPERAHIQAMLDQALPETLNFYRRTPDGSRLLVTSYSDRHSTRWYFLDLDKKTLEELFAARPWMTPDKLVDQHYAIIKSRDGLEFPAYYFLPKGYKPGDKLPTIVHIHGGPHARADEWGHGFGVMEGQLFASRGYAVIVPNYRITPGFGGKIYYSGFGTIGRQMSEDHEDAVKWGIAQGFVDPKRVCISGASYGGYATMMALAKTPDLFKCGIAGAMVSDLKLQLTSPAGDTFDSEASVKFWKGIIGTNDLSSDLVKSVSPAFLADKIKAAVFIYAGEDDIRTPLEQTTAMRDALKRAGNPAKTVMIKEKEGHGYGKVENNIDLYTQVLKFLDAQIGPGVK